MKTIKDIIKSGLINGITYIRNIDNFIMEKNSTIFNKNINTYDDFIHDCINEIKGVISDKEWNRRISGYFGYVIDDKNQIFLVEY